jgi:hypothetical protein
MVSLIVRAKKNFVAYFVAKKAPGAKGRPRKYGDKIVLMELFDHIEAFDKFKCPVYGKKEEVFALAINLLWRPTGDLIRFVLADTSRGPIVLMSNDLQIEARTALQLYCARTRIEIAFDMLKNLIGAFRYRFWSKGLPRHCRKPKKNAKLKGPSKDNVAKVKKCWTAIERFTMIGAISHGLLQLVSIKYHKTVWNHFGLYLRTRSRELPSERTVKHVLSGCLGHIILRVASCGIMREIQSLISEKNSH